MSAGTTTLILAGQSNIVPYCPDTRVVTDSKYALLPNVKAWVWWRGLFNSNANIKVGCWQPYSQNLYYPMTYTPLTSSRLWGGFNQVLAWKLSTQLGHRLSLIQCAEGSTSLASDWSPAGAGNHNYRELINTVATAKASPYRPTLATEDRTLLIWWQGENDAMDPTMAANYGTNLPAFFSAVRSDLGLPNLQILLMRLNSGSSTAHYADVQAGQDSTAGADAKITLFNTDPYAMSPDGLHYPSTVSETVALDAANVVDSLMAA